MPSRIKKESIGQTYHLDDVTYLCVKEGLLVTHVGELLEVSIDSADIQSYSEGTDTSVRALAKSWGVTTEKVVKIFKKYHADPVTGLYRIKPNLRDDSRRRDSLRENLLNMRRITFALGV